MTTSDALWWMNGGYKQSKYYVRRPDGVWGIDVDGLYYFQCKDFAMGYADYMGAPFTSGNAIVLWDVPQPGWTKFSSPQVGDVFVRNFVSEGVNYGDTGLIQEVTSTGVWVIQQNLAANLEQGSPPGRMFWKFGQLLGYLRNDKIGEDMTQEAAEQLVSWAYRAATGCEPSADAADYWVPRIKADPNKASELPMAICGGEWNNDPEFRYKALHYDEDLKAASSTGSFSPYSGDPLYTRKAK